LSNYSKPRCVFLNTYYPAFLENHYSQNPSLLQKSYAEQKASLQSQSFGDSDFYSEGLKAAGCHAEDLILNCNPLLTAWARENNFNGQAWEIIIEQIKRLEADVLYIQDMHMMTREMMMALRQHTKIIAGQNASPMGQIPIDCYDLLFSSYPFFVKRFREHGIPTYLQPLAFDPRVLNNIKKTNFAEKPIQCSFIGGLSQHHTDRYGWLEYQVKETPLEFWGYGAESLPADSLIKQRHRGEAWGNEMFARLAASKITLNKQAKITFGADTVDSYATNMRLYEATGCGALLITEHKENLSELFEIGKEIVAFRSNDECAALIRYYLSNPNEAEAIAVAGQKRTLRDHTYQKRMQQTAEVLERHLRYRGEKNLFPVPDLNKISYGYKPITSQEVTTDLTNAWHNPDIPAKQRALVQQTLEMIYKNPVPPKMCQVLLEMLRPIAYEGCSLLEVGCSSGYYYEILEYLLEKRINYTGVDYSEAMIKMARDYYPRPNFQVADGAKLPYADKSFHIAISSCVILHTPNYREQLKETTRVSSRYVLLHRTPVCRERPTQYQRKYAYEVETVELIFNEIELVTILTENDLKFVSAIDHEAPDGSDNYLVDYLFTRI